MNDNELKSIRKLAESGHFDRINIFSLLNEIDRVKTRYLDAVEIIEWVAEHIGTPRATEFLRMDD